MAATFAEMRSAKRGNRVTVEVCLDPSLAGKWNEVCAAFKGQLVRPTRLDEARADVEALRTEIQDSLATFTFASISRYDYDTITEMGDETEQGQVLIVASCIEPEITLAEIKEVWSDPDWAISELTVLVTGAISAQVRAPTLEADPTKS